MSKLSKAVEAWVRAEWHFRFGPDRYGPVPTAWYCDAEENLRLLITGHKHCRSAAEVLGVDISDTPPPAKKTSAKKTEKRSKARRRVRLEEPKKKRKRVGFYS